MARLRFGLTVACLVIALAGTSNRATADVEIVNISLGDAPGQRAALIMFRLSGTISDADVVHLNRQIAFMRKHTKKPIGLMGRLNSHGGSVAAAISLGRLMRAHDGIASVYDGSICGSACVFVLAGAVSRIVAGDVLIHRPYESNDQLASAAEQKEKYSNLRREVSTFLEDVNIPASLYDDMLRVSPDDAILLDQEALLRYGLASNDPYHDEALAVRNAKELGISRLEYARRRVRAREVCDAISMPDDLSDSRWEVWADCHDRVMRAKLKE